MLSKQTLTLLLLGVIFLCNACSNIRMPGYEIFGIDVSYYQEDIEWRNVANDKVSFSFIKATEGKTIQDKKFKENWKGAGEYQIIRGAYHFFRPTADASAQLKNFTKQVKLKAGDLPPVLDVEVLDGETPSNVRKKMKIWLTGVEKHYKIRPIIYTGLSFYQDYLAGHFDDYPIWIAAYYRILPPMLEEKKKIWKFWQYTDKGKVRGIKGKVDVNVFDGNLFALQALCIPGKFPKEPLKAPQAPALPRITSK